MRHLLIISLNIIRMVNISAVIKKLRGSGQQLIMGPLVIICMSVTLSFNKSCLVCVNKFLILCKTITTHFHFSQRMQYKMKQILYVYGSGFQLVIHSTLLYHERTRGPPQKFSVKFYQDFEKYRYFNIHPILYDLLYSEV